jgi:putative ABC transport system substrate-binding protein
MRRRELLLMATSIIAARAVRAEQKPMPVIGFLGTSPQNAGFLDPFRQGLSQIGYVEGNNVAMEYREAHFHYDQLPALAADLVKRKVDVLVTANGTTPALAAKNATSTIPIVFTFVSDPVGIGLVASLARPGGNVTGFSNIAASLGPKQMELISELVPQADAIAVLVNPNNSAAELLIRDTQLAAHEKKLKLVVLKARTAEEIDTAFASLVQLQVGALLVDPDGFFNSRREQLLALASRHAVPTVYPRRQYVAAGGLISYGAVETAIPQQAGVYTGRILKGARPADLPVQQPTRFELVVNLKTAQALGLTVPRSVLARADEVIE